MPVLEPIAQRRHASALLGHLRAGDVGGNTHPDDPRYVLCARPPPPLLLASSQRRQESKPAPNPDGADPLGPIELVGRNREHVDAEVFDVHWDLAGRLHRIGMDHGAALTGDLRQLGNRLHGADLVVRVHDGHERGVVPEGRPQGIRRDDALVTHGQEGGLGASLGQCLEGVEDGFVLDCARNEVPTGRPLERLPGTPDRQVVAFSAPARENNLGRIGPNEGRHRTSGLIDDRLGPLSEVVQARRIAEILR